MCNEMDMARIELDKSFRKITDGHHAANLIDMISGIQGGYYRGEVRHLIGKLAEGSDRRDPIKVQPVLEGIIRAAPKSAPSKIGAGDLTAALKVIATSDDPEAKALVAKLMGRRNQNVSKPRCDQCGAPHEGVCKAFLLSQGKPVPGWDKMDDKLKSRLQERATEIKEKGPYKDRAKVAIIKPSAVVGKVTEAEVGEHQLYVDSQGAVGCHFHLIADRDLFTKLDTSAAPVSVAPAGQGKHEVPSAPKRPAAHMTHEEPSLQM